MPKGHYTQTVCVLLGRPLAIEEVADALAALHPSAIHAAGDSWEFGGASVTLAFRPEVNGFVSVDVVDHPWPDSMGDPKEELQLFGAWALGHFGPFTYPGGLQRACEHCWSWKEGRSIAAQHSAFIRIRSSYLFGAGQDALVMPADYDALTELRFVTDIAVPLLELRHSLCYFNPNGEVLKNRNGLLKGISSADAANQPPLSVWCNVRLFRLEADVLMMDTVGNSQLDLPDVEACFSSSGYDCTEVDGFLRDATGYLLENGEVIGNGDTMDGPHKIRWQAHNFSEGVVAPPRKTLSWIPMDGQRPPEKFLERGGQ